MPLFLTILSSPVRAGVRDDLLRLYPEQSPGLMKQRLHQMKSADDFFRAFGPYFHEAVRKEILSQPPFNAFANQTVWCAGDAHPENFGVLLDLSGRAYFLLNDLDDNGPCPQAADLLRLLTGTVLALPNDAVIADQLKAYWAGWRGEALGAPDVVQSLLQKGAARGTVPRKKWVDPQTGILSRSRQELRPVSPAVRAEITQWLSSLSGDLRLIDLQERAKMDGGSGGLVRYLALLGRGPSRILLEFKQITRPSTFVYGVPEPGPADRIAKSWQWAEAPIVSTWNRFASIGGLPFFTRPLWEGNLNLNVGDFGDRDKTELVIYEAYLLGGLHRTAVPAASSSLQTVPIEAWKNAAGAMAARMRQAYKSL